MTSVLYNNVQENSKERGGGHVTAVSKNKTKTNIIKKGEVVTGPQERCYEIVNSSYIRHMHTITAYLTQAVLHRLCHAVCKEYGILIMADRFIPEYPSV